MIWALFFSLALAAAPPCESTTWTDTPVDDRIEIIDPDPLAVETLFIVMPVPPAGQPPDVAARVYLQRNPATALTLGNIVRDDNGESLDAAQQWIVRVRECHAPAGTGKCWSPDRWTSPRALFHDYFWPGTMLNECVTNGGKTYCWSMNTSLMVDDTNRDLTHCNDRWGRLSRRAPPECIAPLCGGP